MVYSRAQTIPKAFEQMAKGEVIDLVKIDVLVEDVTTAYNSPSFFREGGKDRGVCFIRYL